MSERGHAAVELALGVGLLLLPAALAVLAFGPWSEQKVAVEAMAAEATRAAVLTLDIGAGSDLVQQQADDLGLDQGALRVGWCGATPVAGGAGACAMTRGSEVSVAIETWSPLIRTPWGGIGGLWVVGTHSEPIDLYRSLG
jgi:hypothetical protein